MTGLRFTEGHMLSLIAHFPSTRKRAALLALLASTSGLTQAAPVSRAFTYQGRLADGTVPANGTYDLKFTLYDAASGGKAVAGPLTNSAVPVSNGLFMVALAFGSGSLTGDARWLEIGVRTNGSGPFARLVPRQELRPTPYALYAPSAGAAGTATNLAGVISAAHLSGTYTNVIHFINPGNSYAGDGSGLTNLNAANIQPGSLGTNQLSSWVNEQLVLPRTEETLAESLMPSAAVTVFPNGTFVSDGVVHTATNSTTAGIQEAIAAVAKADGKGVRSAGGTVWLAPGVYNTTTCITNPWGTNYYSLALRGAGTMSSFIRYVGGSPSSVFVFGTRMPNDACELVLEHLSMSSAVNACTNILYLHGEVTACGAVVTKATISHCLFRYGTNTAWMWGDYASHNQRNLIGIDVRCNFSSKITIESCNFYGLGLAVGYSCSWGTIRDLDVEFCGRTYGTSNAWPVRSPYYIGGGILFYDATATLNRPRKYLVAGNFFVHTAPAITSLLVGGPWGGAAGQAVTLYESTFEMNDTDAMAVTCQSPIVFFNNQLGNLEVDNPAEHPRYQLTNVTDYSTWNTHLCPTNLISLIDLSANQMNGGFTFHGPVVAPNGLILPATDNLANPTALDTTGARLWSDGTNLCVVVRNSSGRLTTNKLTMTQYP